MATIDVALPHAIALSSDGPVLAQLTDVVAAQNFAEISEVPSSGLAPQFAGAHNAMPDFRFNTTELKTLITAALADQVFAIDLSEDTVTLEYRTMKLYGTRYAKASSAHINGEMVENAMLVIESFSGNKGGLVSARCRLFAVGTDSNDPVVFTSAVALSFDSEYDGYFTIGPVKLNGTFLGGIESWTFDNRPEYEEVDTDGEPFLSFIAVRRIRPRLTVQTRHTSIIAAYTNEGIALTAMSAFLRKKARSGINYAASATQHVKFLATDGWIRANQVAGDNSLVEVCVDMTTPDDDTDPYTLSIGVAIA